MGNCYELEEEEVIDISNILDNSLCSIKIADGDSLTFKNSNGDGYRVPVSNEVIFAWQ